MSDVTGVITYRGVEYADVPGFRPLELDLYLPDGLPGPVPVVVHVHGGGWRRGSRRHPLPALGDDFYHALAATGIAVAAIDYRLSGKARYPAAVDDVRAAVAWARSALPGYGIAPGPLVLWGDSAGGHLTLLAALTGPRADDTGVDGVVAWFPVTDLARLRGPDDDDRSHARRCSSARRRPGCRSWRGRRARSATCTPGRRRCC
jgi:acetyl esterase/lipase